MRTLVAAPSASRKHYAFDRWEAATRDYDRLLAIDEPDYAERVEALGVPTVTYAAISKRRLGNNAIYGPRFTEAWQAILGASEGYTHILSLESDVIPPEGYDILALMEKEYQPDFTCHDYPWREGRPGYAFEMGCTIFTRETLKRAIEVCPDEQGMYCIVSNEDFFKRNRIHVVELEHLTDPVPVETVTQ